MFATIAMIGSPASDQVYRILAFIPQIFAFFLEILARFVYGSNDLELMGGNVS